MIADLTLRTLVEGSRLPSLTWEQSGNSAERINQYWKGERNEANLGSYSVLCGSHIACSGPDGRQARKNEGRKKLAAARGPFVVCRRRRRSSSRQRWELVNAATREQSVRDLVVGIANESSPSNFFSPPLARELCLTVMESERPAKERTWPQLG